VKTVYVGSVSIGDGHPLVLISGPCVIETEEIALRTAEALKKICEELEIPLIYKSSFEKDNRSTAENYRGPGLEKGLKILEKVKSSFGIPILSDIHRETDIPAAAEMESLHHEDLQEISFSRARQRNPSDSDCNPKEP